ncbi:MAG: hypothetical protein ABI230_01755 [Aestuariivirga sp.]
MRVVRLLLIWICFGFSTFLFVQTSLGATKPQPAKPADGTLLAPVMDFLVVRNSDAQCEPDCPEWISAEGRIVPETAAKLAKFLAAPERRKLPIILNSGGGSIDAAVAMGRLIRKYKMDTGVGQTVIPECSISDRAEGKCKPDSTLQAFDGRAYASRAYCASACPLVLLGGIHRVVDPVSFVGVHEPKGESHPYIDHFLIKYRMENGKKHILSKTLVKRTYLKEKIIVGITPQLRKELDKYLNEMGGSPELLAEMEKAQPETMNWIGFYSGDRERLGLVTEYLRNLVMLVGPLICSVKPDMAGNCIHLAAKDTDATKPAETSVVTKSWLPIIP